MYTRSSPIILAVNKAVVQLLVRRRDGIVWSLGSKKNLCYFDAAIMDRFLHSGTPHDIMSRVGLAGSEKVGREGVPITSQNVAEECGR